MNDLQTSAQDSEPEPAKKEKLKKPRQKSEPEEPVNNDMNTFFEELAQLKNQIQAIKGSVDEVKSIHDRALNNVTSEAQNTQIAKELDAAMDKTNRQTGAIRNKLKEMDAVNKQLQRNDPNGNDSKIRISQV